MHKARNAANKTGNSRDLLGGQPNTSRIKHLAIPSDFVATGTTGSTYGFERCVTILVTNLLGTQVLQKAFAAYVEKRTEWMTCESGRWLGQRGVALSVHRPPAQLLGLQFCLLMEQAMAERCEGEDGTKDGNKEGPGAAEMASPTSANASTNGIFSPEKSPGSGRFNFKVSPGCRESKAVQRMVLCGLGKL